MKILLYTHEFPPFAGGAGIYTSNLAKGLSELGHNVTVLAPAYKKSSANWDVKQLYLVIRIHLPQRNEFRFLRGCLYLIKNWIHLKPDIALITDVGAQISATLATIFFLPRYSITIHGSEIDLHFKKESRKLKRRLITPLIRRFFQKAENIICVSQATKEMLLLAMPDLQKQTTVVLHGIDLNRFKVVRREEIKGLRRMLNLRGAVLLTIARLIPGKGHDIVIKTLKKIVRDIPDIKYLIVGTGPDRERLEALVKKLSLERYVLFIGKVPDNNLGTYYALCDIFIMISRPSERVEGFGLVYAEAGAYNKPVIAGRTGGVPEAVEDGYNGILVESLDESAIETAIRRLLTDSDLARRMGANGRKRVENEFNAKVMAERSLKVLLKS